MNTTTTTTTTTKGQSLLDLAIQTTGSAEGVTALLTLNPGLSAYVAQFPAPGTILTAPEPTTAVALELQERGLRVNTTDGTGGSAASSTQFNGSQFNHSQFN